MNENKGQKPEKGPLGTPIPAPIVKPSDTKKKGQGSATLGQRPSNNPPATAPGLQPVHRSPA